VQRCGNFFLSQFCIFFVCLGLGAWPLGSRFLHFHWLKLYRWSVQQEASVIGVIAVYIIVSNSELSRFNCKQSLGKMFSSVLFSLSHCCVANCGGNQWLRVFWTLGWKAQ
jgi:hypothetical protein